MRMKVNFDTIHSIVTRPAHPLIVSDDPGS